jgi:hypothetical protein
MSPSSDLGLALLKAHSDLGEIRSKEWKGGFDGPLKFLVAIVGPQSQTLADIEAHLKISKEDITLVISTFFFISIRLSLV